LYKFDTCPQMFDVYTLGHTAHIEASPIPATLWSACGRPALFPLQRHPVVWSYWYQRLMLLGGRGSLLNCRQNARWTETTDLCFTNCSTQNTFCSGVAIIAVLCHRGRENRGVGMRMHTTLTPAVSFHVGNLLLRAFSKPETAPIILIHPVYCTVL
jgi:hypothetical protein